MANSKSQKPAFIAVTSLFFLWALAHNLNPILLPHLKNSFSLNNLQSALVDSSFYLAYFFMALPAAMVIQRFGYPNAMLVGLLLFAIGAFAIYPAATYHSYPFFLFALFIIATGLTFLETSANPYVNALGKPEIATFRLNFAQAFNGLGASVAAFMGGSIILSESAGPLQVRVPYLFIGILVVLVGVVLYLLKLPALSISQKFSAKGLQNVLANPQVKKAVLAQFFYVGAQVGINGFFILYTTKTLTCTQEEAAQWLSLALFLFMVGRFAGSALLKLAKPTWVLKIYAAVNLCLLLPVVLIPSMGAVICLVAGQFFMSIMFPTIFSLGIKNLGAQTSLASSLLVMAVAGGAFITPAMGWLADNFGIKFCFLLPMLCFGIIYWFAHSTKHEEISIGA